ncbi:MAG TPA: superinfection immunity protein [Ferrovibrio sp.]|jgi:CHASE2 domain-containing sensor protein|uniref:superinfection immunity protein n=1 Tax=Ferrovibrio sp. TaxID=1917215 RepID=UPI002B4B6D0D|nr:superinfection immunity protein [Ferrovibrio sp.]HLT75964.1 superinfection immunity protein [Ferrovibrio sp.]
MGVGLFSLVSLLLLACVYFLPSLLAWRKRHRLRRKILIANALLGWTVIGWAACLILALRRDA